MTRWVLVCLVATGCGDNLAGGPSLEVTSPTRGLIADSTTVVVEGRAVAGIRDVARVLVNGQTVELGGDGSFRAELQLAPGTQLIETVAIALGGGESRDIRSVSLGERAGATRLEGGSVFHAGTIGLARTANNRFMPLLDNDTVAAQTMAAPIADVATGCPQNDVLSLTSLGPPIANMFAYSKLGGVAGELLFMPIDATVSADYPDAGCADQSGTFDFDTLELHYAFSLDITGAEGDFEVTSTEDLRLYDHPLFTTNVDIVAAVFDRVSGSIEAHMADALIPAGTAEFLRLYEGWLESFNRSQTAAVGGATIQIQAIPDQALESADGLSMVQDLVFEGVAADAWVPTPTAPVLPVTRRGAIAYSDDAIDQLLGGVWAAGGFTAATASGAALEMLVPPSVTSDGALTVGDWILTDGDLEIALVGTTELIPIIGDTDITIGPGEVALEAQVVRGGIDSDDRAALVAEVSAILAERVAGSLAALSITLVEESAPMLAVEPRAGYLVMDTFLPPPP